MPSVPSGSSTITRPPASVKSVEINSSVAHVSAGGVSTVTRPPLFERRFNLLTEADYRQFEHREMTSGTENMAGTAGAARSQQQTAEPANSFLKKYFY